MKTFKKIGGIKVEIEIDYFEKDFRGMYQEVTENVQRVTKIDSIDIFQIKPLIVNESCYKIQ